MNAMASQGSQEYTARHIVAYQEGILKGEAANYLKLSSDIGGLVQSQAIAVQDCLEELSRFIIDGSRRSKPTSDEELGGMLNPLGTKIGKVRQVMDDANPRDALYNHVTAVGECIAALGWVQLDSKPVSFIAECEGIADAFLVKVAMTAKSLDNPQTHRNWANAVRGMMTQLKQYVKEFHTTGFLWNAGVSGTGLVVGGLVASVDDNEIGTASSNDAFRNIVENQLASYVSLSEKIGGDVGRQALCFRDAWKNEGEFLDKAVSMPKPPDETIQEMLRPVVDDLAKVSEFAATASPRDSRFNHLTAIGESAQVLGWVGVPSKAVSYISDVEGAGDFYLVSDANFSS